MSILRTLPSIVAACGLTFVVAASASAQDASAPSAPRAGQGQHWAEHRAEMRQHMEKMRAEHLKTLHDALSIRPDQEGAWQAFVAATAPQPHQNQGGRAGAGGERQHLTTPERLDRAVERMQKHLEAFQRRAAAVKALYGALTPTQQRTFDALAKLHGMGGMHGGHGGMHGGFGHGGPGGGMGGPQGGPGGE